MSFSKKIHYDMFYNISVPRTCSEYKARGHFKSGYYLIDPDQKKGRSSKFKVYCDFENGKGFRFYLVVVI